MDVNASKGIMVSRKGFSKKAISKANRVGIKLCLASEINEVVDTLKIELPIRVNVIQTTIKVECKLHINKQLQSITENSIS